MSDTATAQGDDGRGSFEEEHLREYLGRVADTLNISGPKYDVKSGSKIGDNFVGVVYRVSIEGDDNGVPVKIETIFKVPPTDETQRLVTAVSRFFPREHVFYTEIVPILEEFLRAKNKRLENVPRCYFSNADDHKEAICLEDLRPKGFVMRDRIKQLDLAHATLAFRALGRMHALSFALRDQRPDLFARKIAALKEPLFTPEVLVNERMIARLELLEKLAITALAEEDPVYAKKFLEFSKDILTHFKQSSDGSIAEPYAVLCHGDFWTNNMLFKYDEDSEDPKDVYLLDFQMSRYASPATDLSYNLFCSCGQDLRTKHFDELVKIYHDSLSAYLLELGSDPKKLFPFEALVEQIKKFSNFGGGMALLVLHLITSQGDDINGIVLEDDWPQFQERINRDIFFRDTYRDTFKDLIDRNYI